MHCITIHSFISCQGIILRSTCKLIELQTNETIVFNLWPWYCNVVNEGPIIISTLGCGQTVVWGDFLNNRNPRVFQISPITCWHVIFLEQWHRFDDMGSLFHLVERRLYGQESNRRILCLVWVSLHYHPVVKGHLRPHMLTCFGFFYWSWYIRWIILKGLVILNSKWELNPLTGSGMGLWGSIMISIATQVGGARCWVERVFLWENAWCRYLVILSKHHIYVSN